MIKSNNILQALGRDFNLNGLDLRGLDAIYLTLPDVAFTESQITDFDYMLSQIGDGNLFQINNIKVATPQNEESERLESLQDFSYEVNRGRYRHKIKYDLSLDYIQKLDYFTGNEFNIIYGFKNRKLLCKKVGTTYTGFTLNDFTLEKLKFLEDSTVEVFIELMDASEVMRYGEVVTIDWKPSSLDKVFLKVVPNLVQDSITGVQTMTLQITYNNTNFKGIQQSEVTINDDYNGDISFSYFDYDLGVYKIENFDKTLSNGCISINTDIALGRARYKVSIEIITTNNAIFGTTDNWVWGTSNNAIFDN